MEHDLTHHGDREVTAGLVDLAVNVRMRSPPDWLRRDLEGSVAALGSYPDTTDAVAAIAARHGRDPGEVLPTAGAAEAFTLLATATHARHPVVVHPQFTEPEAALRAAGHDVRRVVLSAADGFTLHPELVPERADLVYVGNPTNPTSVLHPASTVRALCGPGRLVVVDEAFADAVPGEQESLADTRLPGVVVIRSLTKTWGIAGLRAGYLLAEPDTVEMLRRRQPHWSVSTPAAVAMVSCSAPAAVEQGARLAARCQEDRRELVSGLRALNVELVDEPRAPFVLTRIQGGARVRERLRAAGYVVRRGDTFPGLDTDWMRVAVREPEVTRSFLGALSRVLTEP